MPSGTKQLVVNGLERAVSSDINRLQLFEASARAEILRYLCNVDCGSDDIQASSFNGQNTTLASPASGEVYGGLIVRPIGGTMTLSVDAGAAMMVAPDADPDSSVYKLAIDPVGVSSGAPLVIAANASGQRRIDVVEVSYSLNANAETDNRDIFDPLSGAFAAVTVSKASQGVLTYQIRQGTGGAGFPGTATGFMPLCVISVPSGAASVADCTFWDVRPFVGDRVFAPHRIPTFVPRCRNNLMSLDVVSSAGKALVSGYVEASASDRNFLSGTGLAGLYRLGGNLSFFNSDLNVAGNQSGTLTNGPAYVYLLEPFGLPRWAVYTTQSGALKPGNPRGIPTVSSVQPVTLALCPSSALALPANTGLGGTTSKAVCIGATKSASSVLSGMLTDGRTQTAADLPFTNSGGTPVGSTLQFAYTAGTHYPAHASALWITFEITVTVVATTVGLFTAPTLFVDDPTFTTAQAQIALGPAIFNNASGSTQTFQFVRRVKVPAILSGFGLVLQPVASNTTITGATAVLDSWEVAG